MEFLPVGLNTHSLLQRFARPLMPQVRYPLQLLTELLNHCLDRSRNSVN